MKKKTMMTKIWRGRNEVRKKMIVTIPKVDKNMSYCKYFL